MTPKSYQNHTSAPPHRSNTTFRDPWNSKTHAYIARRNSENKRKPKKHGSNAAHAADGPTSDAQSSRPPQQNTTHGIASNATSTQKKPHTNLTTTWKRKPRTPRHQQLNNQHILYKLATNHKQIHQTHKTQTISFAPTTSNVLHCIPCIPIHCIPFHHRTKDRTTNQPENGTFHNNRDTQCIVISTTTEYAHCLSQTRRYYPNRKKRIQPSQPDTTSWT